MRVSRIRCSKFLRIPIRIRIRDTPNFSYPYLVHPYFLEHWLGYHFKCTNLCVFFSLTNICFIFLQQTRDGHPVNRKISGRFRLKSSGFFSVPFFRFNRKICGPAGWLLRFSLLPESGWTGEPGAHPCPRLRLESQAHSAFSGKWIFLSANPPSLLNQPSFRYWNFAEAIWSIWSNGSCIWLIIRQKSDNPLWL